MRPLTEYSAREWLHGRPLSHALRNWRIAVVDNRFYREQPPIGKCQDMAQAIKGKRTLVTIAFNDPEIVDWHLRLIAKHAARDAHVVFDNSSDEAAASKLQSVTHGYGVDYIRLPRNPWVGSRHFSRSHGAAMNWAWRNVLKPGQPSAIGFIDHDIMPTEACDPFAELVRQPLAGDKRRRDDKWYLWAGYSFFRFETLANIDVDFGVDWSMNLDTGGGNWAQLYRMIDPASINERPVERVSILPDADISDCYIQWHGSWLHEVGWDNRPHLRQRKRDAFLALAGKFA